MSSRRLACAGDAAALTSCGGDYSGHTSETGAPVAAVNANSASVAFTSPLAFTSQMQGVQLCSPIAAWRR